MISTFPVGPDSFLIDFDVPIFFIGVYMELGSFASRSFVPKAWVIIQDFIYIVDRILQRHAGTLRCRWRSWSLGSTLLCLGPRCSTYYIVCFLLLVRSARKILFCSIAVCSTVAWLSTSNGGIRVFARIGSLRMIQNEPASKQEDIDLVALDAALTRLAEVDPEQS